MILIRKETSAIKPILTIDTVYEMYLLKKTKLWSFGKFVDYMKSFYTIY